MTFKRSVITSIALVASLYIVFRHGTPIRRLHCWYTVVLVLYKSMVGIGYAQVYNADPDIILQPVLRSFAEFPGYAAPALLSKQLDTDLSAVEHVCGHNRGLDYERHASGRKYTHKTIWTAYNWRENA